jgi:biotin carboxyl carrier protein
MLTRWLAYSQMEYPVVAPADGEVKAILVEGSQLTHQGDALLVLAQ